MRTLPCSLLARVLSALRVLTLALLLPVAQAGAGIHALDHLGDADHHGMPEAVCEWCAAYASQGAAAPAAAPPPLAAVRAAAFSPALFPLPVPFPPRHAYQAQGPPVLS